MDMYTKVLSIYPPNGGQNKTSFKLYIEIFPHRWKAINENHNFSLDLTLIRGLHTKLWASKVVGVLILRISGLLLGSRGTKWHLNARLMAKHREYYKEEGGGFPQVWAMASIMSLCLLVVRLCIKSVIATH
jgi:hypothetical protein